MQRLIFRSMLFIALAFQCLAVQAVTIPGQGTWMTDLQARDLDHNGTVDAYFDKGLGITWLAEVPFAEPTSWEQTLSFVDNLRLGGYSDWRLPAMGGPANGVSWNFDFSWNGDTDNSYSNTRTEMGHLFYVTLGNQPPCAPGSGYNGLPQECLNHWPQPGDQYNTGPFKNLELGDAGRSYWSTTTTGYGSMDSHGAQIACSICDNTLSLGANFMVVRTGDVQVPAIPEPSSAVLLLVGCVALMLASRSRHHGRWRHRDR